MQIIRNGFILLILWYAAGCKKYIEVESPKDQILSEQVFTDDSKANSAVSSIYGNMINGSPSFTNFVTSIYAGLSSDELLRYNPSLVFQEFMNNQLTVTNSQVRNIWSSGYKNIYYANAALEGISSSTGMTANFKKQLTGECKFIRAFCYFYLVNLFGDVPLVVSTDYQINTTIPRSKVNVVYDLIVADLNDAKNALGEVYPSGEKVRPNKWAATALLARVYLYLKDWANAEVSSSAIINSGLFTPLPSAQTVFLKNSKEAIWQLMPLTGYLPETKQIRPSGSTPQIYIRSSLINLFEPGDQRRLRWVDSVTFQTVKYYYPGKYKNTTTAITEYYMVLRAGEQYLIRAEARANQNNLVGAISDLNVLRTRAAIPAAINAASNNQVVSMVMKERQTELFGEWSQRWLDLKRTDSVQAILGPIKSSLRAKDILYPIPQDDLNSNINLTQNPGY